MAGSSRIDQVVKRKARESGLSKLEKSMGTLQIRMFVFTNANRGKVVLVHRERDITIEKATEFVAEFVAKNKKVDWELSWQADPIHLTK